MNKITRPLQHKLLFPVAALLFFFFAYLLADLVFLSRSYRQSSEEAVVKITKGDNLRSVAVKLERSGVIFNSSIFIAAGKIGGYEERIIPGEYRFPNGLTNFGVLEKITDPGHSRSFTVTIPEGLNIRQIGRLLSRQLNLDSAKFVKEAYNDSLISRLGIEADNLEGFLFPDTYNFSFGNTRNPEAEVVNVMVNEFMRKIDTVLTEDVLEKRNAMEIITMASIVEAETRHEPEKRTISGVYYNRLKKRMRLEADPTVQYVLPDGPKKRLVYSDLKYPSPYNTYLNRGLPPGPINNPGLSSILAAVYPEEHRFLYFVAKGDGSHRFAETYEDHKKNIREYRKFLEEQDRKTDK